MQGIEPTYSSPESLIYQSVNIVGYGVNGSVGSWFSRCDGKKRAVTSYINGFKQFDSTPNMSLLYSNCGYTEEYNPKDSGYPGKVTLKPRPLKEYEGGVRPGMSGGGVFLNAQYLAIPTSFSVDDNAGWWLPLRYFLSEKLKYLAAIGIPVPFMIPIMGNQNNYLVLGTHKDWIETARQKKKLLNPR